MRGRKRLSRRLRRKPRLRVQRLRMNLLRRRLGGLGFVMSVIIRLGVSPSGIEGVLAVVRLWPSIRVLLDGHVGAVATPSTFGVIVKRVE